MSAFTLPSRTAAHVAGPGIRGALVRMHRLFGLSVAAFLVLAGVTGSFLVFQREIDAWLNPDLWSVSAPGPARSPATIAARVAAHDPRVQARWMPMEAEPATAYDVWVDWKLDARTGRPAERLYDQMFVDPVSGAVNGVRRYGVCCLERAHLVPFVHAVHSSLFMPGRTGAILLGIVAIVWLIDSMIGFALTLPRGWTAGGWARSWAKSWRIKRHASPTRRVYDLHRAGGLWTWALLALIAGTSIALTLEHEVFAPAVSAFSPIEPEPWEKRPMAPPDRPIAATISFDQAFDRAADAADRSGISAAPAGIYYAPETGLYGAMFGREEEAGLGSSWVYVDGINGRVVETVPAQSGSAGDVFMRLQLPVHAGRVGGLPTRLLAFALGLATAMLAITGVLIWLRKRRARHGA